jgi:AcrR family transcriptional regulator
MAAGVGGPAAGRRRYEMRARADAMAETRLRITEATVHLHGTIGPARTTVSRIAEEAGVQRHTVYRHFATDAELFAACTAHYWGAHPWPAPPDRADVPDPRVRLGETVRAFAGFYADTEQMLTLVLRDADQVPHAQEALGVFGAYLDGIADDLAGHLAEELPGRTVRPLVLHVLDFSTWRSLVARLAGPVDDVVELLVGLVCAGAGRPEM